VTDGFGNAIAGPPSHRIDPVDQGHAVELGQAYSTPAASRHRLSSARPTLKEHQSRTFRMVRAVVPLKEHHIMSLTCITLVTFLSPASLTVQAPKPVSETESVTVTACRSRKIRSD
jgi:hypothetical protein